MDEVEAVACSLGASEVGKRLGAIAEIGAESLISHEAEDGRYTLRFHSNACTRQRLAGIVAAEAECCSFLELSLTEKNGELLLAIAAPDDGQAIADELAAAFTKAKT